MHTIQTQDLPVTQEQTPSSEEQAVQEPVPNAPSYIEDSTSSSPYNGQNEAGATVEVEEVGASGDAQVAVGVIFGDVNYKGITISAILEGQPLEILGEPIGSYEDYLFYCGLEIKYYEVVGMLSLRDLSMFAIDGISLDKSRKELIAAFGDPIEYYLYPSFPFLPYQDIGDDSGIRYHVSSETVSYVLQFFLNDPYGEDNCSVWLITK